ncbi:hypothetical protein F5B20DRAFT_129388 [Whalleya microplaca]|nr:hypothetical protein F5B20DRAFT_129388 [Whalleya microplaca]
MDPFVFVATAAGLIQVSIEFSRGLRTAIEHRNAIADYQSLITELDLLRQYLTFEALLSQVIPRESTHLGAINKDVRLNTQVIENTVKRLDKITATINAHGRNWSVSRWRIYWHDFDGICRYVRDRRTASATTIFSLFSQVSTNIPNLTAAQDHDTNDFTSTLARLIISCRTWHRPLCPRIKRPITLSNTSDVPLCSCLYQTTDWTATIEESTIESTSADGDEQDQELSPDFLSSLYKILTSNQHSRLRFTPIEATPNIQGGAMLPSNQQLDQQSFELTDYYCQNGINPLVNAYSIETRTYTCFYLLAASIILSFASLGISLWWSIDHEDVSGGFGMGSYMVGISSLVIAVASYTHRSNCRCWVHDPLLPS